MKDIIKKRKIVVALALVVIIGFTLVGCSGSRNNIYGSWVVAGKSVNENLRDYPEENFVIYENGSFTCDGFGGTYSMNDDTITLNLSIFGSHTYEYDISGKTLMLRIIDDEDRPKIYYDKVS